MSDDPLFDKVMEKKNTPIFKLRAIVSEHLARVIEDSTEEQLKQYVDCPSLVFEELMKKATRSG